MSTVLGGVTLSNNMVWSDEFTGDPKVGASVENTLGGGKVIQEFQWGGAGRLITLTSENGQGLQTKAIVDALKILADVANATYSLAISHNSLTLTKTVRFRNEVDGGPVQFQMVSLMDGLQTSTFYYSGSIYLMVVS